MQTVLAFQRATLFSEACFVFVCALVLGLVIGAIAYSASTPNKGKMTATWFVVGIGSYLGLFVLLVRSGWIEQAILPNVPIVLAGTVGLAASLGFTNIGKTLATSVPLWGLVLFQGFRFPLELILHDWSNYETIPETMTWTGNNPDIITGLMAIFAAPFVTRRPWLAWIFNVVGILLLVNVARVAVLSSPVPFGWDVEPPLEVILYLPYAFIVPICVGGAALGHVVLTRKLLGPTWVLERK